MITQIQYSSNRRLNTTKLAIMLEQHMQIIYSENACSWKMKWNVLLNDLATWYKTYIWWFVNECIHVVNLYKEMLLIHKFECETHNKLTEISCVHMHVEKKWIVVLYVYIIAKPLLSPSNPLLQLLPMWPGSPVGVQSSVSKWTTVTVDK